MHTSALQQFFAFSALTLLVGRQEGHPASNNRVVRCWHGYLSGSRCRLDVAQLMPLPLTVSCFSKIQIGFTFLVPAHLGSPGKEPLNGCVCVCITAVHKNQKIEKSSNIESQLKQCASELQTVSNGMQIFRQCSPYGQTTK